MHPKTLRQKCTMGGGGEEWLKHVHVHVNVQAYYFLYM